MGDYALGYLNFGQLTRDRHRVDFCPSCQVQRHRDAIRQLLPSEGLSKSQRAQVIEHQQDIYLLLTRRVANLKQLERRSVALRALHGKQPPTFQEIQAMRLPN